MGLGAVLAQLQSDGFAHPIAYASRALSPSERNYGITDLETLAIVGHCLIFTTTSMGIR